MTKHDDFEEIDREFDEKFGIGYYSAVSRLPREIVRDEHRKFLHKAILSDRKRRDGELREKIEKLRINNKPYIPERTFFVGEGACFKNEGHDIAIDKVLSLLTPEER